MMDDNSDSHPGGSGAPPDSLLPYDQWMQEAMRGVVVQALNHAALEGLPGAHHFYITFRTDFPGVVIPPRLAQKYPEEMTIVLQHQFDKLYVDAEAGLFGVSLSFGGVLSALKVPLAAVTTFVDPHVQYGLRFAVQKPAAPPPVEPPKLAPPAEGEADTPQVVSLDAFRRRRDQRPARMAMLARLIRAPAGVLLFCAALLPAAAILISGPPGVAALLAHPAWSQRLFSESARALVTVALGWPLGVLAAFGLWRASLGARRIVLGLALSSLLIPAAWSDHGLLIVVARLHPAHGLLIARLAGAIVQNAAITLLVLTSALNRLDPALLHAAAAAGATPRMARAQVMRPLLRVPLRVAALVAFGFSLARDPAAWGGEVVLLVVCFLV